MMENGEDWANQIISRWDKSFKHRWIIYTEAFARLQNPSHICLDIGCGKMSELSEGFIFKASIGTDIIIPQQLHLFEFPFLQSDLYSLPFKNQSIDIILLRFVVEHIKLIKDAFNEIHRILKPDGKVLILTTNIYSPLVFLPKVLPYKIRKQIILKIFGITDDDIFPTYHRLNSRKTINSLKDFFQIEKWQYIESIIWSSKPVFYLFLSWYLFTKWTNLKFLRSNFIVLLKKN